MDRFEDEYISKLETKSKQEQISELRRLYTDETPWLSKGTIMGGARFVQGGFNSTHFPLELIQNADDEGASALRIEVSDDEICVYDNGNGFDLRGVVAVCQQGRSPKNSADQIGFMGIGFKSLFEVCSQVEIHSNGYHFAFTAGSRGGLDGLPEQFIPKWVPNSEDILPYVPSDNRDNQSYKTKIIGKVADPAGMVKALDADQVASSVFLFLRKLKKIRITGEAAATTFDRCLKGRSVKNPDAVQSAYEQYTTEKGVSERVDSLERDLVETVEIENNSTTERWTLFRNIWDIPDNIPRPQFREHIEERELFVALPLDENDQLTRPADEGSVRVSPVHSYLPIKQLSNVEIDFIVHADFDLDPTRARIKNDSKWNSQMANQLHDLILMPLLRTISTHDLWAENLHLIIPKSQRSSDDIIGGLLDRFARTANHTEILSDGNSDDLFNPSDATRVSSEVHSLFTPDEVYSITQKRPVIPSQEVVLDRLNVSSDKSVVDLLKDERCESILNKRAGSSDSVDWFSDLYRGLSREHSTSANFDYKRALANKVILTQNNTLSIGRDATNTDTWTTYLPPKSGFEGINAQSVSKFDCIQYIHQGVCEKSEPTPVRNLFEEYGAEEATALAVVLEEVKNRGTQRLSRAQIETAIEIISNSSEIHPAIREWMDCVGLGSQQSSMVRDLLGLLEDGLDANACAGWIVSHWGRLDNHERESSLIFLHKIQDRVQKDLSTLTVRTRQGNWVDASDLVLPEVYSPSYNFERLYEEYERAFRNLSIKFVDSAFAEFGARGMKELFERIGAGSKIESLAGEIGEIYVERQLGDDFHRIKQAADFESEDGLELVEVKSTKEPSHDTIELKGKQLRRLMECESEDVSYYVYPVVNVLTQASISPRPLNGNELLRTMSSVEFDIRNL